MNSAKDFFKEAFDYAPTLSVRAPGRVNLIGEHTDYNLGFVFPMAINYATQVSFSKRRDSKVRVTSCQYTGELDQFDLLQGIEKNTQHPWANYVRGMVNVMQADRFFKEGFDLAIVGNVPQGAGLSSSASLEVAIGFAVSEGLGLGMSKSHLAVLAQKAENQFVGCNCGIMDQMVSALAVENHALLLDCRSLESTAVPVPKELTAVIIHSNVKRGLVDSFYNERRQQCERAAEILGVSSLREVGLEALNDPRLQSEAVLYKRAHHVLTENERVNRLMNALKSSDWLSISECMTQSHASLRDDFEVSHPAVDALVDIVSKLIGKQCGVRMTGGGFGGCVVALVPQELRALVEEKVLANYLEKTGLVPTFYTSSPASGVNHLP